MGMQRTVEFADEPTLDWPALQTHLAESGVEVQMRMIDNLPAFPDEQPPAGWGDLRVAVAGQMITLRKDGRLLHVITWGNADAGLQEAAGEIAAACAEQGGGTPRE